MPLARSGQNKKTRFTGLFFWPEKKPPAWLLSGIEVKSDVFRFEKPTVVRFTIRSPAPHYEGPPDLLRDSAAIL